MFSKDFVCSLKIVKGRRSILLGSDNGEEFTSKEFTKYYKEAIINLHFSVPYSSQQNDIVEQCNITLIEM